MLHCNRLAEEWQDCEELEPKPTEKWTFVDRKGGSDKALNEVVCGHKQTPLHEVRKKQ